MPAKYLPVLFLLCCMMQLKAADAVQPADITIIDSMAMTQAFDARSVVCEVTAGVENGLTPGKTGNLIISFSSSISDAPDAENARAVVLNGLVAVAFPPGLEMAGDSRLYFFNPATGVYEFMYSGSYPQNALTTGLAQAMANASASNPRQIIGGLGEICEQLSPGCGFSAPRDPRINGGNPAYSVAGKSWLVPVSLMQNEVVNPFSLSDSIAAEAKLRVSFPFRVTGDIAGSSVVVYAGGLSTGAAQVVLAPADIPQGALPLMPFSQGDNGEPDTTPIPAIVYAHQWVALETEFILSDYISVPELPALETDRFRFEGQVDSDAGGQAPSQSTEVAPTPDPVVLTPAVQSEPLPDPPPANLPNDPEPQPEADTFHVPFIGFDSGDYAPQPAPAPLPVPDPPQVDDPAPAPQPQADPEPSTLAIPPAVTPEPAPVEPPAITAPEPDSVLEVELGTIPEQDTDYRVPLKQITGSAQSSVQPTQQNWVADDLGGGPAFLDEQVFVEEGYFLMGTSNLSSAGDQDELPQTSVFLPDFYIDKYPVTNRKFYEFVIDAGYKPQGKWDKYYSKGTADLPVRGVTWNDANEYAQWAGKRLPTEAEWEKACRGVDGRLYPWGDNWSSDILPRGELIYDIMHAPDAESPYGAMAMVGVFWQWTASSFALYPYDANAVSDEYVLRGGCFSNGRNIVRCANRYSQPANVALNTFGFRCASDPQ